MGRSIKKGPFVDFHLLDKIVKAKETTSYYASGEIIGQLLMAKGQIKAAPATEATFDASLVKALAK